MKKLLIASLIASTSLMAVADETTLYGSIGYYTSATKNNASSVKDSIKNNRWNLDNDELNWGIKGEENISDNLNAFWKLEFGNNGSTRRAYVGLQGADWGTFTLGTHDSLYKNLTNYNDIFQADTFWNSINRYEEGLIRPERNISYVSPNWSGFQFGIAGILNGKDNQIYDNAGLKGAVIRTKNKGFGVGQVGLWYSNHGFYASLAYQYADGKFDYVKDFGYLQNYNNTKKGGTKLLGGSIGYKNDTFKVGLTEQHKFKDGDKATLAGEYYFGPNTIRAGFGFAKSNELRDAFLSNAGRNVVKNNKKVYNYALGYQYNLSKRTYTYVEANYTDWNAKHYSNGYEAKVGLRHDF